jgi:hypothetical protein
MKTIRNLFEEHGFWRDEAETTDECVGFSRFEEIDGCDGEVYSFGTVDQDSIQVYSTHPRFSELKKGLFEACESDGPYLTVWAPVNDRVALGKALDDLDEAVRTFFQLPSRK